MKKLSTVFFLMLMPMMSIAQTGTIKARVIDAKTGKELKRVVVKILETTQGTLSKNDGYATIMNVRPAPNYTIYALFAGYKPRAVSGVKVFPNTPTQLQISLSTSGRFDDFVGNTRFFDTSITTTIRYDSMVTMSVATRSNHNELVVLTPGVVNNNANCTGYFVSGFRGSETHTRSGNCTLSNRSSVMIDTQARQTVTPQFAVSEFSCPTSGVRQTPKLQKLITITPNPSNSIVRLSFTSDAEMSIAIHIYNSRGTIVRTIRNDDVVVGNWSTTVNMSDCTEGTYVVQLIQGSDVRISRFVLLKQ